VGVSIVAVVKLFKEAYHFACVLLQVIRLRKKLSGAADAVKGLFGVGKSNDEVVEKLEKMQVGACMIF
jgi:hypothetical protein